MFILTFLSKNHTACHNGENGIKAGSNSKETDKLAAECSKAAYLGVHYLCVMHELPIQQYSLKYRSP